MERIYKALSRLSQIALVAGLTNLVTLQLNVGQQVSYGGGPGGPQFFPGLLFYSLVGVFHVAVSALLAGIPLLGLIVAWADYRRRWILTLAIALLVVPLTQAGLMIAPAFLITHPRVEQLLGEGSLFLLYGTPLLPVALAVVFAHMRGGGRAALRAEADTTLEITRSPL